jgi:hypothetical protein
MKLRHFIGLACLALLFAACGNPAWVGPKPTSKVDKLASETCTCVYDMMGAEPGWNRDAILDAIKDLYKANKKNWHDDVRNYENPDIQAAFVTEEDFSMKMDDCDCMKPVQDALLEQGVSFDDMMASLDIHCLLGAFYN